MLNSSPWLVGSFRGFLLWYYIVSVITVEMKIYFIVDSRHRFTVIDT